MVESAYISYVKDHGFVEKRHLVSFSRNLDLLRLKILFAVVNILGKVNFLHFCLEVVICSRMRSHYGSKIG